MTLSWSAQPAIDPRGPRFAAGVTAVVLVIVLVTGSTVFIATGLLAATVLLAAQAVVFALGAFAGLRYHPYGLLYRTLVAPRLAPPTEREDPAPVRFSQGLGFSFTALGVLGYATGFTTLGMIATALALGAAFLNAAFGYCLGCEIYLRLPARLRGRGASPISHTPNTERGAAA